MVKNEDYGNEGLSLAWDIGIFIDVRYVSFDIFYFNLRLKGVMENVCVVPLYTYFLGFFN